MNGILAFDKERQMKAFYIVATCLIALQPIIGIVSSTLHMVLPGKIGTLLIYGVLVMLVFISYPIWIKKLTGNLFLVFAAWFLILLISCLLCGDETKSYLIKCSKTVWIQAIPMYLTGTLLTQRKDLLKKSLNFLPLIVNISAIYFMLQFFGDGIYNQSQGYNVLPAAVISMAMLINVRQKLTLTLYHIINMIISVTVIFMSGARGPLLCFFLASIFCIIRKFKFTSFRNIIVLICYLFIGVYCYFNYEKVLLASEPIFKNLGVSTRIINGFLSGDILESQGRIELIDLALRRIAEKPLIGTGIFLDRQFLFENQHFHAISENGSVGFYVHNIFIEWILQFGIILGGILLVAFIYKLYRAWRGAINKYDFVLFILLCAVGFFPLLVSGSYVDWPLFYFLLGYMASEKNIKGRKYVVRI